MSCAWDVYIQKAIKRDKTSEKKNHPIEKYLKFIYTKVRLMNDMLTLIFSDVLCVP